MHNLPEWRILSHLRPGARRGAAQIGFSRQTANFFQPPCLLIAASAHETLLEPTGRGLAALPARSIWLFEAASMRDCTRLRAAVRMRSPSSRASAV